MSSNPIGIFDSGLGGLAIFKAIQKKLPYESTVYLADHLFFPYGNQPSQTIIKRLQKAINFFKKHQVKIIVLACNTATVTAIKTLRQKHPLPFIGTVPAIKPALINTSQKILVLTTNQTTHSRYYHQFSRSLDKKNQLINYPCPKLVDMIEKSLCQPKNIIKHLSLQLQDLPRGVKLIVLGCTHFILIKKQLKNYLKHQKLQIKIIEPSQAIAKQTKKILSRKNLLNQKKNQVKHRFFTTKNASQASQQASCWLKTSIIFSLCRI